jgi:hypothetical protein
MASADLSKRQRLKARLIQDSQVFHCQARRFALNGARQWIERRQRWEALLERGLAEELAQRRQELQG